MDNTDLQYNKISSEYCETKQNTLYKFVIDYSIQQMLRPLLDKHGLLTGKRVLDLGCGDGRYTRHLKALKCDYILGIDISSEMIKRACDIEYHDSKYIDYIVGDARQLSYPEQPFDLVTAFFLFNHCRTRQEMLEIANSIYTQLGENGQFIGITNNVAAGTTCFQHRKYGRTRCIKIPLEENVIPDDTEVFVTFYNESDEPTCTIIEYYHSSRTYEEVFKKAGFKTFQWVLLQCDLDAPNKAFYDDYIACAPAIGVVANK